MTNYGRTTTSGNNTWVQNTGSNNQYGYLITSVPQGRIDFLDVYMAGSGGTCRTRLCIWNSSGTLLASSAQFTAAAGSGGINGQALQRQALSSPLLISGGSYYVGFWRNGADTAEWSYISSGSTIHPSAPSGGVANVGSPSNLSTGTSTTGQMTAYMEWTPSGVFGNHIGGLAPTNVTEVYGNHIGGLAPVAVIGIYRGPSGGGSPLQIW